MNSYKHKLYREEIHQIERDMISGRLSVEEGIVRMTRIDHKYNKENDKPEELPRGDVRYSQMHIDYEVKE